MTCGKGSGADDTEILAVCDWQLYYQIPGK